MFCLIVMTLRLRDEPVGTNRPLLVAVNSNGLSSASWARVRARPGPTKNYVAAVLGDLVHRHDHVWESGHESTGRFGDGAASNGRSTTICLISSQARSLSGHAFTPAFG